MARNTRARFACCPQCRNLAELFAAHDGLCGYCFFVSSRGGPMTNNEAGSLSARLPGVIAAILCAVSLGLFASLPAHAAIPRSPVTPAPLVAVAPVAPPVAPSAHHHESGPSGAPTACAGTHRDAGPSGDAVDDHPGDRSTQHGRAPDGSSRRGRLPDHHRLRQSQRHSSVPAALRRHGPPRHDGSVGQRSEHGDYRLRGCVSRHDDDWRAARFTMIPGQLLDNRIPCNAVSNRGSEEI